MGDDIAFRRPSGGDDQTIAAADTSAATPPIPSVQWFVEDTTETETETAAGISDDLLHCVASQHRALSLPNLADDNWGRKSAGEMKSSRGDAVIAHHPGVAVVTDANMTAESLMTSAVTSSSHLKPPNSSVGTSSKMKRNKSFAEHPVITAVSYFN